MKFGISPCTQSPPAGEHMDRLVDQIIEQAQQAERYGFDSFLLTEHHQQPDGYLPSPLTMAAAIAAKTSRIKVGSSVLLLPLYHAVRVAEDAAVVDIVSKGRLILAMGAGYVGEDYAAFGIPKSHLPTLMEEGVEIIKRAWTEDNWSFYGQRYRLQNMTITPKPVQKPRPPIWLGGWTTPGIKRAARMGDFWYCDLINRVQTLAVWAQEYYRVCQARGKPGHIAVFRDGYCAPTTAQADAEYGGPLMDSHTFYHRAGGYNPAVDPWLNDLKSPAEFTLDKVRQDRFILGSPEDCIREIEKYERQLGAEYIVLRLQHPSGPPHAKVMEAIRLFGEKVIPHFAKARTATA